MVYFQPFNKIFEKINWNKITKKPGFKVNTAGLVSSTHKEHFIPVIENLNYSILIFAVEVVSQARFYS